MRAYIRLSIRLLTCSVGLGMIVYLLLQQAATPPDPAPGRSTDSRQERGEKATNRAPRRPYGEVIDSRLDPARPETDSIPISWTPVPRTSDFEKLTTVLTEETAAGLVECMGRLRHWESNLAIEILHTLKTRPEAVESLELVAPFVEAPWPIEVRREALALAALFEGNEARSVFERILAQDPDPLMRLEALVYLTPRIAPFEAVRLAQEALVRERDERVRAQWFVVLGLAGGEEVRNILDVARRSTEEPRIVRAQAVEILAWLETREQDAATR